MIRLSRGYHNTKLGKSLKECEVRFGDFFPAAFLVGR